SVGGWDERLKVSRAGLRHDRACTRSRAGGGVGTRRPDPRSRRRLVGVEPGPRRVLRNRDGGAALRARGGPYLAAGRRRTWRRPLALQLLRRGRGRTLRRPDLPARRHGRGALLGAHGPAPAPHAGSGTAPRRGHPVGAVPLGTADRLAPAD